tara:strand:+ start:1218 stop:1682 length:465 start_codon:yes stop_codon:yes gene_type:complete
MTTDRPQTKILFLTKAEALYLDDAVTVLTIPDKDMPPYMIPLMGMRPVAPSAMLAVPPDLVERIGMAVLLTTTKNGLTEAALEVGIEELYFLREAAQSTIKFLDEAVGYNLKRKIYMALLEDEYKDSLQFAKLMEDMETDSVTTRNKAKTNFSK